MKAIVKAGIGIPSVKVKILKRFFAPTSKKWLCICQVTSRKHPYYTVGEELHIRYEDLFLEEKVKRGSFGKLYWIGKPEFDLIPIA